MEVDKINIIDWNSELFPAKLREIKNPPKQLYCAGDISLLDEMSVAVVGSRRYTAYGKLTAQMIGEKLAQAGVVVVSGLAFGIDSFAHEGTLAGNGKAVAVLGTGHNNFYPRKNLPLYKRILASGLVVSEYAPDVPGGKHTFPARNRIISGLSECVVVVEATMNSGSLITSQFATEQGREVYAVPGNISSQFSAGTNFLIRDGARPLIVLDDLVNDLGINVVSDSFGKEALGEDEIPIVQALMKEDGVNVNELAHILNMKVGKLSAILTLLEVKGVIMTYGGKLYLAKTNV